MVKQYQIDHFELVSVSKEKPKVPKSNAQAGMVSARGLLLDISWSKTVCQDWKYAQHTLSFTIRRDFKRRVSLVTIYIIEEAI